MKAEPPPKKPISNLRMVWNIAMRYPWQILAASLALLVSAAATAGIPYALKLIIDRGFTSDGDIARWFQYLLLLVVIMAIATALRFYFVSWMGERVVADIRLAVHRNLMRLSPSFFEENRPAEITSRITVDTAIIEQTVGVTISVALRNLVLGVACAGIIIALSPKLAGLLLLAIPLILVPIIFLGRKVRAISKTSQDRLADVGTVSSEVFSAMKIVLAFGQQHREAERFSGVTEEVFTVARRRIFLRAVLTGIAITLFFAAITLTIWQGALDVRAGTMTGGTILAFVLYGGLLAGAFGALSEVYGQLLRAAGASERLNELMQVEPTITAPANPAPLPSPARGRLTFEDVTFRYPTRPDDVALDSIAIDIKPDELVALVGPSGAGKTTIFQLAQRFYDPDAGRVLFDDVDIATVDPEALRQRIAMVPQEVMIFAASARDNLRYGHWDASDEEIWEAARAAHADDFLRALPQGLDTYLGEGGARLSGGQRQRLAIARALLRKDAPLLLLDEATSALDAESEARVQSALDALMGTRTTIVIAHRLATVRAADRILVMDQGRIVEEGTHDALIARGGLYARLAKLQFDSVAAA
ncbi:ABC transporter transmembrane domain-containing protein [Sphingomicrobium aestuariivivum]|uniref:ABC transporter transmembrane domain-containing protein n=1 Tax=Sphingomicrobium aestuariivivum TaxID=1582356 RepID=UPI001FD652D9|nr:ABC transporter transmembrane domain-containing protein [Sphingomicrobium aestuariivivum]MCJ8191857.1 ABC transporter transmembrane domain-containing protein [Sphingomicrobium aestuariivivum]